MDNNSMNKLLTYLHSNNISYYSLNNNYIIFINSSIQIDYLLSFPNSTYTNNCLNNISDHFIISIPITN